jgi:hypothetical protein
MKDNTKKLLNDLSNVMVKKCKDCPSDDEFRCCDVLFCGFVEKYLNSKGIFKDKPNVGGIPYMGEKGCVLPPELRPQCTGFSCQENFEDRKFRREYDRLVEKINKDPDLKLPPRRI